MGTARRAVVALWLWSAAVGLAASPRSRDAELILTTNTAVERPGDALALVRRNALLVERQLKDHRRYLPYGYIDLPYQPKDWREGQLPPHQVEFLFRHARVVQPDLSGRVLLPPDAVLVAKISIPVVKAGSRFETRNDRVVVRWDRHTTEAAVETYDLDGKLVSRRTTTCTYPVYAKEVWVLIDTRGRIFF